VKMRGESEDPRLKILSSYFVILHFRTPIIPNLVANADLYMFRGETKPGGGHCATRIWTCGTCTVKDKKEVIVRFVGREDGVYALLDKEQLEGHFKGSIGVILCLEDEERLDGWQLCVEERERGRCRVSCTKWCRTSGSSRARGCVMSGSWCSVGRREA
jgi:hypothetical protein